MELQSSNVTGKRKRKRAHFFFQITTEQTKFPKFEEIAKQQLKFEYHNQNLMPRAQQPQPQNLSQQSLQQLTQKS